MLQPRRMAPAARTENDPVATCRNCGRALAGDRAVCERCGAAHGFANQCPHCHAIADVERHSSLGFRCLVCGGPRVALDVQGVRPSERTNAALQQAGTEQTKHLMFSAAGFSLVGMGLLALLVTSLVVVSVAPSALLAATAYLASVVPVAVGAFALSRAAGARKQRSGALRSAQVSALADVQTVTGVLTTARVSEVLRISGEQAELLLAEASVASYLNEAPAPRVRVHAAEPALDAATELPPPTEDAASRRRAE